MKENLNKYLPLIIAEILIAAVFCIFYGRFGDIMIDSFREAYIPQKMLQGEILYKNIFCIYPPLSYLINAFLFKIFGTNLHVLYVTALFTTMGIFFFINKIINFFSLNKISAIGINLFIISSLVMSPNVFNTFFPYSFGILYGLLFTIGSLYCRLNKYYSPAFVLYALAICCKPDFILLLPVLLCFSKKENLIKNIISFIIPIILTLSAVLVLGTDFSDILTSVSLINIMSQTETLKEFYTIMGLIPRIEHIPIYLANFLKFIFPITWFPYQVILIWIFPFTAILFAFRFKTLNKSELFFVIASILISFKVFFGPAIQSYGNYFFVFALISVCILLNKTLRNIFAVLLIFWSLVIGFYHTQMLLKKDFCIETANGIIKVSPSDGKDIKTAVEFLQSTPDKTVILAYPECLAINYFTERNSDSKFYSLIPLYIETFGEDNIINRLQRIKPDYIIINSHNTLAYGYGFFGKDYALNIIKYINKHYTIQPISDKTVIFKRQ